MRWALNPELAIKYERAVRLGVAPTEAQHKLYTEARSRSARADGSPQCLVIAGDVAQITVEGVLTPYPDFWAWFVFGANTAYSEVLESLAVAEQNTIVKRVEWLYATPGGMVDGLFDVLAVMEAFSKPMKARASLACSAGYAMAAMSGKIEATSPAAEFGSIGTLRTYWVDGPAASEVQVDITSTEAPDKRPDVKTDEGKAVVRRELDVLHDLMVDAVARGRTRAGRPTTIDEINAEFGRGAGIFAEEARAKGMVDKVPPRKPRAATSGSAPAAPSAAAEVSAPEVSPEAVPQPAPVGAQAKVKTTMNKKEFQETHPEVYAAIRAEGRAEGVTAGEQQERDRVVAHLTLGEASGDMKTAVEAVTSGVGMTATINAKYMAASMNRRDQNARQSDSNAADEATRGANGATTPGAPAKDLGDKMADLIDLPPDPGPKNAKK